MDAGTSLGVGGVRLVICLHVGPCVSLGLGLHRDRVRWWLQSKVYVVLRAMGTSSCAPTCPCVCMTVCTVTSGRTWGAKLGSARVCALVCTFVWLQVSRSCETTLCCLRCGCAGYTTVCDYACGSDCAVSGQLL